jgi:hypothetical protein
MAETFNLMLRSARPTGELLFQPQPDQVRAASTRCRGAARSFA